MTAQTQAPHQSLTDRYVWAAIRSVPGDQRAELDPEIRERIGDAVQARIDHGETPEEAERAALVELGDPERLAAAYVERPLYLIGPRYYLDWLRLVRLLLFIVLPIVLVCLAGGSLLGQDGVGGFVGAVVGGGLTVAVHMVFWTTLVFVLIERHERAERAVNAQGVVALGEPWTPENLPPVPGPRSQSRTDLVVSVVWQLALGGVWIWLATSWSLPGVDGHQSLFDADRWRPWLPWFLGLVVAEIVFEYALYRRGWSWAMAAVNALLQTAFAVPAIWLLTHGLLAQAFFDRVGWPEGGGSHGPVATIAWVTVLAIAVSDAVQGFLKAHRAQQAEQAI